LIMVSWGLSEVNVLLNGWLFLTEQWKLVKEALRERKIFLETAPHLSSMLPILLPIYTWWQLPYYYAGCKLYDILAGPENMESAYWMGKGKSLEAFPMLKSEGLVGGVVYYDGQSNHNYLYPASLNLENRPA